MLTLPPSAPQLLRAAGRNLSRVARDDLEGECGDGGGGDEQEGVLAEEERCEDVGLALWRDELRHDELIDGAWGAREQHRDEAEH